MKKFLVVYLYFVALSLFAQGYKHYDIEQGLPSNRVYKILQDKDGFIWIATDKGLSKFDGARFVNFTTSNGLPSNDIWEIMITPDNKVWYFTRSNALGYIKNDSVYKFKANAETLYPNFISKANGHISFMSKDKNFVFKNKKWVNNKRIISSTPTSIVQHKIIDKLVYDKHRMYFVDKKNKSIDSVAIDYSSNLSIKWQVNDSLVSLLDINRKFYVINLNRRKIIPVKNAIFKHKSFIRITDFNHEIQISGDGFFGLLSKDYKLKNLIHFDPKLQIATVFKDINGNYWGTSYNKGIYFFSKNSLQAKYFFEDKKVNFIKKIGKDLFAGIIDEGIYRLNRENNKFEMFFPASDYFYDMFLVDLNNYVVFGSKATWVVKNKHRQAYEIVGRTAVFFNNAYYTSGFTGVNKFDANLQFIQSILQRDTNKLIVFQNRLIAGDAIGLTEISDDKPIRILSNDNFSNYPILALEKIGDQLLIGTDGNGLFLWDGTLTPKQIPETKTLMVDDIFVQGNRFWLATQQGVLAYEYHQGKVKFINTIRKTDGLISDHVNQIAILGQQIYTSNYNGISSVALQQNSNSSLQNVYFTDVFYQNKRISASHPKVYYQKNNNLNVRFGVIDFFGQEHNKTFSRLIPLQPDWNEIQAREINYNNLPPGKYTLEIKATNPYRKKMEKAFSFVILPLWYQSIWGKILIGLGVLLLLLLMAYFIRRYELNKQEKKLKIQKQMTEFELHALRSQMNPHFVFNSLNAIQYYINDENFDKSEAYLVRFARLIRMIFDLSREKNISLQQEVKLLKSYLNLEKMRFGEDFNYCFEIDKKLHIEKRLIPTMLLQPIVENAVNHGIFHKDGKGTICLSFQYITERTFLVQIKDDGVGMEKSKEINRKSLKKHQSKSTQILKDRIKLLNLSGKWRVTYQLDDVTQTENAYSTIISLKITQL